MLPIGQTLSYDAAPAFATPLRFFVTAPLFGAAAGVLLVLFPELLASRWTPGALALTHLVAVGFMLSVMVGALFQILPVVAGATIPQSSVVSALVHAVLTAGTACLAFGLAGAGATWLIAASILLGGGLAIFLIAAVIGLRSVPIAQATPRDLRLALLGFAVAVTLGILLALVLGRNLGLPLLTVLKLHVGWALIGGCGILLAASSWVVVPMFQITPNYPARMTRFWAMGTGGLLVLWSAAVVLGAPAGEFALMLALAASCVLFTLSTLRLQRQSRRPTPDPTMRAFQLAMASFMVGLAAVLGAHHTEAASLPVIGGVLILYGGFVSVICGMLYKIIPFLAWLHLTQDLGKAPNMKKLQPDAPVRRHFSVHAAALALALVAAASGLPLLVRAAGLLVILDFSLLLVNVVSVLRAYRAVRAAV